MRQATSLFHTVRNERGSILIGGLVLVLVITLMGIAVYEASVMEHRLINQTEADLRAFYAADAGIHRAALDVADPDSANPVGALTFNGVKGGLPNDNTTLVALAGYGSTCFGGSACGSSVAPYKPAYLVQAKNDTANADRFWVVSTACTPGPATNPCASGSKQAQVQAEILKTVVPGPPTFQWGAFGGTSLGMGGNGAVADSYNSHKAGCAVPCPYGGTNVGTEGDLGSNGSIDLTSTITVKGNIVNTTNVVADPSDINLGSSVTVTGNVESGGTIVINGANNPNGQSGGNGSGTTAQVSGTVTHDTATAQIVMPALPNCGPPYTDLTGKVTQYQPPGNNNQDPAPWTVVVAATWKYGGTTGCGNCGVNGSKAGELVAGGGAYVSLAPGTYCLGNVSFTGGTWVLITDRTVLTADGQFTLSGGGLANASQLAQNLQIISTYGNDSGETKTGVTLSGGSATYATIYAPTTLAVISGGGDLYGGVMANKVSFTGGSGVHFDEYLATGNANLVDGASGNVTTFSLLNWKRLECGPNTFSC